MSKERKITSWLHEAGARRVRMSGENAVGTCPFHRDNNPSFAMNVTNGLYVCYSAACGARGNLATFLIQALRWPVKKAIETADEVVGERATQTEWVRPTPWEGRRPQKEVKATDLLLEAKARAYMCIPMYMTDRGFRESTLLAWEVGFDKVAMRVTLPVRDHQGECVGISKRGVLKTQIPPYLHNGFSKGQYLYGEHLDAVHGGYGLQEVWASEGQLDAMALRQIAPHVKSVSTMGSLVTTEQIELLGKYSRVVMAFDADEAGRKATTLVGEALLRRNDPGTLFVANAYPEGVKDPCDLLYVGGDAQREFLSKLIPYEDWRLTHGELKRPKGQGRVGRRR